MRVTLFTREYPPNVYGGAGVHATYLARELSRLVPVEVRAFEGPRGRPSAGEGSRAIGFEPWSILAGPEAYRPALEVISVDLAMVIGLEGTAVVHSHTWYANLAGHLAKLTYGIPHVMTTHSLEPLRPWKATQLGEGGYALSSFCERTAIEAADTVIAVSAAMRDDVLHAYPAVDPERVTVIRNGVDTDEYAPNRATDALVRHGVDPERPYVLFVGRITRQKGLRHLLAAAGLIDRSAQLVLCASAPDSEGDLAEAAEAIERAWQDRGGGVIWLREAVPVPELIQLFSHAAVFVCPSIYEPMGIVNLEAMACGAPVVATATGGIPEVVADGETGLLVPIEQRPGGDGEPIDPAAFASALAERVNTLVADPLLARRFGDAGRSRAVERFSWRAVAHDVLDVYERLSPALRADRSGG